MLLGFIIASIILVADQVSKFWVMTDVLGEQNVIVYTSFFNLVRAWNTGVSFSMFNDHGNFGAIALSVLALIIIVFLVFWLRKEQSKFLQVALGFIIGGALGNVIDRVRFGAVFDFLDFHLNGNHWPAFNVADSFICIGAVLIILQNIYVSIKKKEAK